MEDSLKGLLVTLTIIALFITCVVNFTIIFPQEQGITFSGVEGSQYLTMQNMSTDPTTQLTTMNNESQTAFDQWDITQGFMGSNSVKQGAKGGATGYTNNIFTNLKIMATQIFGENSPVLYALGVLLSLTTVYLIYLIIKFVRTGN